MKTKRLLFIYPIEEICTRCGNITLSRSDKNKNVYRSACAECLERKSQHIQQRRQNILNHVRK